MPPNIGIAYREQSVLVLFLREVHRQMHPWEASGFRKRRRRKQTLQWEAGLQNKRTVPLKTLPPVGLKLDLLSQCVWFGHNSNTTNPAPVWKCLDFVPYPEVDLCMSMLRASMCFRSLQGFSGSRKLSTILYYPDAMGYPPYILEVH